MITIKSIARVPGFKTKVVVASNRVGVDPIGTIIGPRGERIKSVKALVNNENIELVK
jgi:N utilization substance protein A